MAGYRTLGSLKMPRRFPTQGQENLFYLFLKEAVAEGPRNGKKEMKKLNLSLYKYPTVIWLQEVR